MKFDGKAIRWKPLLIAVGIPLAVGGLSALLTRGSMDAFLRLRQPPLTPPAWVFPAVWAVLYALMGAASYLVATANATPQMRYCALIAYGLTLLFNFVWPLLFFRLGFRLVAFVWLVMLFLLIILAASLFGRVRRLAGLLLIPYLLWTAFAGYLNFGVYWLNR